MVTSQQIEATKAFQELSPVTKLIYQKKAMMDEIKREVIIVKNIGLQEYDEVYRPRPYKKKVIIELLELEN